MSVECALHDMVDVDAELVQDEFARRAGTEAVDADGRVGVALPPEGGGGLDRQRRARRAAGSRRGTSRPARRSDPSTASSPHGRRRHARPARRRRRRTRSTSLPVPTSTTLGVSSESVTMPAPRCDGRSVGGDPDVLAAQHQHGRSVVARRRRPRPASSRCRRRGGSRGGRGSPAGWRGARPAGGSGRPRRHRPSRG